MPTTPRGVPYPIGGESNDVPADLQALAEWVDEFTAGAQGDDPDQASRSQQNTFSGPNFFTSRVELGDTNSDVLEVTALTVEADTRNLVLGYTGNVLNTVTERNGTTTLRTVTLGFTAGVLTQISEAVDGKTITTSLGYTAGALTSVSRSVA